MFVPFLMCFRSGLANDALKYTNWASMLYFTCILFVKISILLSYVDIFAPAGIARTMYWTCHILIWANVLYFVVQSSLTTFAAFRRGIISAGELSTVGSSISLAFDVVLLVLPQTSIWRLQMSVRKKVAASSVFCIGLL